MSTPIDDGGSAFPEVFTDGPSSRNGNDYPDTYSAGGMTLRDHFAGVALEGFLASFSPEALHPVQRNMEAQVAQFSYKMADAMIAARKVARS